jgi:hypothetical protein
MTDLPGSKRPARSGSSNSPPEPLNRNHPIAFVAPGLFWLAAGCLFSHLAVVQAGWTGYYPNPDWLDASVNAIAATVTIVVSTLFLLRWSRILVLAPPLLVPAVIAGTTATIGGGASRIVLPLAIIVGVAAVVVSVAPIVARSGIGGPVGASSRLVALRHEHRVQELRSIFSSPAPRLSWSRRTLAITAGAVLLGTIVEISRQTGTSPLDSLWAEDGAVFLQHGLNSSLLAAALMPYGGYAQLAPRLLAAFAAALPLPFAAVVLSGGAALVVSGLALFVYHASAGLIRSTATRVLLAAAVILVPIAPFELTNNAESLHYYLLYGAFWALVWLPNRWPGAAAASAIVAMAALSDPLAILLVPLGFARIYAVSDWRQRLPAIAGTVAIGIQAAIVLANRDQIARGVPLAFGSDVPRPGPAEVAVLYPLRVVIVPLLGPLTANTLWRDIGWAAAGIGAIMVAGLLVYVIRRPDLQTRWFIVFLVVESAAFFALSVYLRWDQYMFPIGGDLHLDFGSRYTLVPILLLCVAMALALDHPHAGSSDWAYRAFRAVAATALVFAFGANFAMDNLRSQGPSWAAALATARERCSAPSPVAVEVRIAPPGWSMVVPCGRLLSHP